MMTKPEFIVIKIVRDNKNNTPTIRNETIRVDNIENIRVWHNRGANGVDEGSPMSQITLKSPMKDDKDDTKKLFKILVAEDADVLNEKIGAVKISE